MRDLLPPEANSGSVGCPCPREGLRFNAGCTAAASQDHSAYVLQANAIRLADAAVRDYLLGGHSIAQHHERAMNQFGLAPILLATTHFESCIWHLERFIKHVRALRACATAEPELKELVPKTMALLQGAAEGKLTQLRHTLAHLERRATSGRIPKGTSLALLPLAEGLEIAGHNITWDELASWLRDASECASRLANFRALSVGA